MGIKPSPSGETFRFFHYDVWMKNYRTSSHSRYDLKYHFVWVTKYRKPVLTGEVSIRVRDFVREICQRSRVCCADRLWLSLITTWLSKRIVRRCGMIGRLLRRRNRWRINRIWKMGRLTAKKVKVSSQIKGVRNLFS